jgi:glucose-6-phosphate 1-dehydrogenase
MQILSIVAMEKPNSTKGEDIRDEKVKVLRCIPPIKLEDVVIGQYTGDKDSKDPERQEGYLDDKGVPKDSTTPTYAQVVLSINNERWAGVPFILRAGKALNEKKAEIRIQFRDSPDAMFGDDPNNTLARDELVIRIQPNEAIYLKLNTKRPGEMGYSIEETELDLTYGERYKGVKLPDAYERLILDVFMGSKINFVRSDELQEAWRIVDPILAEIDKKNIPVVPYKFGSAGLREAYEIAAKHGYVFRGTYVWKEDRSSP